MGAAAEDAAALFLKSAGYRILARNFSTKSGEIDIIAADGDAICFVEVKARTKKNFAPPYAAVNRRKQDRIRSTASAFLAAKRLTNKLCRFDVVSLVPAPEQKSGWQIELLRNAF